MIETPAGPYVVGPPPAVPAGGNPRLSVVVPTYNEARNLRELLERLCAVLDAELPGAHEIIVVDDDSPDRSWELAESLAAARPQLKVIRRIGERSLSTAVVRGWQASRGDLLAVLDADLQHRPEVLAQLYGEMRRGADLAVASRHLEGGGVSTWSLHRRLVSRAAQVIGLLVLPGVVGRVSDPLSGYFMLRRAAIEGVRLDPAGYKILIEVLARARVRWIGEVPYVFRERVEGNSKVGARVYADYLRHLLRLRLAPLPFGRFLRFGVVGASGVVIDMGLLFLLSDPSMLGWGLTRSKLIASEAAIVNNFLWNDAWTFRDLAAPQRRGVQKLRRFGSFQLICGIGLALNTVLLNLQFNLLHMNRYAANAVAIAAVTAWNYWLNLKLNWRVAQPALRAD